MLITHKEGVYDLTEFAAKHPGGADKLMMAKGGPIEPFWEMYPFHKEEAVYALLGQYRVGTLHPDDVLSAKDLPDFKDLQTQNLGRSPDLRLLQKFPYCAETPAAYLSMSEENFLTPSKKMFERNHNLIPELDPEYYELELLSGGKNDEDPITLSLEDLKSIKPTHEVMATIACAGSKR